MNTVNQEWKEETITRLLKRIESLRAENTTLIQRIAELEKENQKLRQRLDRMEDNLHSRFDGM